MSKKRKPFQFKMHRPVRMEDRVPMNSQVRVREVNKARFDPWVSPETDESMDIGM